MPNYFNPAAFFVILREVLEAVIIISVLLRYVDKATLDCKNPKIKPKLKRDIWIGTTVGLVISLLIGIIFTVIFYVIKIEVFVDATEQLFEGILYSIAVCLLTWLALSMVDMTHLETKWEKKISDATADTSFNQIGYSFLVLAFTIVFREGVESVILITGVGAADPISLVIPGILGIIVGIIIGYIIYRTTAKINMKAFLIVSIIIILIISAGIASNAAHEFEEYYHTRNNDEDIPLLWNTSECCSEDSNGFFAILQALTGYRSKVSVATFTTYLVYWVLVLLGLVGMNIKAKKMDRDQMMSDKMMKSDNEFSQNASA